MKVNIFKHNISFIAKKMNIHFCIAYFDVKSYNDK